MRKFEAVLLLSPDLSKSLVNNENENFSKIIETAQGKVISSEDWGLKDISFKIENYKKAFYRFYQIEINGSNIIDIKKNLTQNEKILRHLIVNVEKLYNHKTPANKKIRFDIYRDK